MKKSVLATCFESFQKKMTHENAEKIGNERKARYGLFIWEESSLLIV